MEYSSSKNPLILRLNTSSFMERGADISRLNSIALAHTALCRHTAEIHCVQRVPATPACVIRAPSRPRPQSIFTGADISFLSAFPTEKEVRALEYSIGIPAGSGPSFRPTL